MIQSIIQAIPTYTMLTFKLPDGVSDDMDDMVRKFWWESNPNSGRGMALKSWKEVCKPKRLEGLGFQKFKDINQALLAKLG